MHSELVPSGSACDIQIDEQSIFIGATEQLFQIISDAALGCDEKMNRVLDVGLAYFSLDTAVISSITGDTLVVIHVHSETQITMQAGVVMPLASTPDSQCVGAERFSANNDCRRDELEYRSGADGVPVLSYIGKAIQTFNGPFGSVCFSSPNVRPLAFTELDDKLLTLISGWLGYLLDINDQLGFMESQNAHYKSLFASIPAVMFLCDADGLVLSASDQFAEKIGVSGDLVPGQMCAHYFSGESKKSVSEAISKGYGKLLPARLQRPDKIPLEVELDIRIKPIGTMQNVRIVIATDVSARNEALRAATEKNRLLQLANEGLKQFAFVASHDLQEPLRKIQQFGSFLEEDLDGQLDGDGKYHLEVIVNASVRMSDLIKDLLNFSRASTVDPEMTPICLNSIVYTVLNEIELLIKESGAIIQVGELPTVNGNRQLLSQLFTNLVSNSIKYRAEKRKPKITISAAGEPGNETIIVSDNGIGFEMKYSKKIFEPFNRLHNSDTYKGTGIGLAICSTACEKHGWSIEAESRFSRGSKFTISLGR